MATKNILTKQSNTSNTAPAAPQLTPELVNRIAARSGIEEKFIRLWATQLITDCVTDQDGSRLVAIWLDLLGRESAE